MEVKNIPNIFILLYNNSLHRLLSLYLVIFSSKSSLDKHSILMYKILKMFNKTFHTFPRFNFSRNNRHTISEFTIMSVLV